MEEINRDFQSNTEYISNTFTFCIICKNIKLSIFTYNVFEMETKMLINESF